MKRRDFVKGLSVGTAAGAVIPTIACSRQEETVNTVKQTKTNRDSNSVYIERYSNDSPARSGMALGGIGTGSVELRKDGKFYNWSIFNNFPKGTGPEFFLKSGKQEDLMASNLFFVVRYEIEGEEPKLKLLQINSDLDEGGMTGIIYYFPWMEAIENIEYKARFPFVNMKFTDKSMPFDIEMEAYSPFIPHDIKNSSLPLVNFNFSIKAKTDKKVKVMLMSTLRNNVGYEDPNRYFVTEIKENETNKMINMTCGGMSTKATTYGQQVIASLDPESTYYSGWGSRHPYYEYVLRHDTLPNLDDTDGVDSIKNSMNEVPDWMPVTKGRNIIDKKTGKKKVYTTQDGNAFLNSTIAVSKELNETVNEIQHSFVMTWNFPNQYAENKKRNMINRNEGHYYSNAFSKATEVAEYAILNKEDLYNRSKEFLNNFFDSTADIYVLEQINSQLNTFITSSRFVREGYFGIQEGLSAHNSWGPLATTDVSLYGSIPVLALFPELQKMTMYAHKNIQAEGGEIAHGLHKNFHSWEDGTAGISHRRDLPGQYVTIALRDFFWTNDKVYLKEMWPSIKKAIDYATSKEIDRNGDNMPEMIGNRSSYDNFPMFGLSSYVQSQWICAMASATKAAGVMEDEEARIKYSNIHNKGKELMEKYLWNGDYYRLYNDYDNSIHDNYIKEADSINHFNDKHDKDEGCLTDQIIGQWTAHLSGLGYILKENKVKKALQSIIDRSFKSGFGLRNASWPDTKNWSDIPAKMWIDQGNTFWTGVELAFASFLIYEGFYKEGLEVIKTIDDRYRKAGLYWDHQEFGGHYYRPMSAWAILNAMLGFSINQGEYRFKPQVNDSHYRLFFTFPEGTAQYIATDGSMKVKVLTGKWTINSLNFKNHDIYNSSIDVKLDGTIIADNIKATPAEINIAFSNPVVVKSGQTISIS